MMKNFHLYYFFLKNYKKESFLLICIFSTYTLVETTAIAALYPLINQILGHSNQQAAGMSQFIDMILRLREFIPLEDQVLALCSLVMGLTVTSHLLGLLSDTLSKYYQVKLYERYYNKIYHVLFNKNYGYFVNKKQGDLVYTGITATGAAGEIFFYLPNTVVEFFKVSAIFLFLLSLSPKVTLILLASLFVMGLIYQYISTYITYPLSKKFQECNMSLTSIYTETTAGIKQIKIFNNLKYFYDVFKEKTHQFKVYSTLETFFINLPDRIGRMLGIILIVSTIIYLRITRPADFTSYLPLLAVYLMAIQKIMPSISNIGKHWIGLKTLIPRLLLLKDILINNDGPKEQSNLICPPLEDNITLKNVTFSYEEKNTEATLNNCSLLIPKNKMTAIVGSSGAGKSTLVNLLMQILHPQKGDVQIDGTSIYKYSLDSWKKRISLITQDPFIFHLSVKENIRLGKLDATDEEIIQASKLAYAHDFIRSLSDGYDTVLGDRGMKLSGGQKQRIAIARCLIRNPDLIILDEATSSLDNISEKIFQDNLKMLQQNHTLLVIAHRLTTIEKAHQIVVMDQGFIKEQGKHEDLLRQKGLYYSLYYKEGNPTVPAPEMNQ